MESREASNATTTTPGRRTKKMRDAELQLEMEEREADEQRFQSEEEWAKRECKSEKVYCLKEAEGYVLAARESKEEFDSYLAESEQAAEAAYGKYTKMIATGKLRAIPIVRIPKKVLTSFQRHFNLISTSFQRHFNLISTSFQPHFNLISTPF